VAPLGLMVPWKCLGMCRRVTNKVEGGFGIATAEVCFFSWLVVCCFIEAALEYS